MTHLSLFTGIGGLDLAAEAAGFQTVGQCEWADFPTKVLEKHWPNVPRWRDIRTLTGGSFYEQTGLRTVDLISGGFPCQPFSTAGKRRGREDDRYLWPEMLRVIEELRPRWIVGENVAGIISMALDTVLTELESQGYETRTLVFPACAVDAPHRRDRLAIIGYSHGNHASTVGAFQSGEDAEPGRVGISPTGGKAVAHTDSQRLQGSQQHGTPDSGGKEQPHRPTCERRKTLADAHRPERSQPIPNGNQARRGRPADCGIISDPDNRGKPLRRLAHLQEPKGPGGIRGDHPGGTAEHGSGERRTVEPGLGGGHDGLSAWMDGVRAGWADGTWEAGIPRIATSVSDRVGRLKALGNAVVPAQFYPIFQAIADIERSY